MTPSSNVPLWTLATVIRSKNAGPFQVTVDLLFKTPANYELVKASGVVTRENVAAAYRMPVDRVQGVYFWDSALAAKVTFDRLISAGAPGDNDCYGAQQHAPLLTLQVPTR